MSELNMADVEMALARQKLRESCLRMAQRDYGTAPFEVMLSQAEKLYQFCTDTQPQSCAPAPRESTIEATLDKLSRMAGELNNAMDILTRNLIDFYEEVKYDTKK